jgi:hypothetical protein
MAPQKAKKKAEPKAKTKTAAKAKATSKAKVARKAPPKKAAKVKAHADVKSKPKAKAKVIAKKETHAKPPKAKHGMNEEQKTLLLELIQQVVHLRKTKPGGLRSFFMIDRILDTYNQKYVKAADKFDAIVRYGVEKNEGVHGPDVYIFVQGREKDESSLYQLLTDIDQDKIKFDEIRRKLLDIVTESQAQTDDKTVNGRE